MSLEDLNIYKNECEIMFTVRLSNIVRLNIPILSKCMKSMIILIICTLSWSIWREGS